MAVIKLPYEYSARNYQLPLWDYMEQTDEKGKPKAGLRACCVWHRRAGKDLCAINIIATKMFERVGTYWHMLPTYKQGRAIVWNGFTKEGRSFLSHFPEPLVKSKNATEMRITTTNGSIYQVVGTDNINSLVGTNPVGVVFSEYSLHDPAAWNYIRPILAENDGWAIFIFTARGKNHGYDMVNMARDNKKWFFQLLVAGDKGTKRPDKTPVISDDVINEERLSGMPEEMIQQEYYCSFEAPLVGAYYSSQMMWLDAQKGPGVMNPHSKELEFPDESPRFGNVPWDPRLPVHTAWDIGYDDATTIWFYQMINMERRFIDYYENSGEGLAHYVKVVKDLPYTYGVHNGPWDISITEFTSGKTRLESAKELGLKFKVCKQHDVADGINTVRQYLPGCWFDKVKCERGIRSLREYRKEWNDEQKCYSNTPLHNWASHGADAFRIAAMSAKDTRADNVLKQQRRAKDDFDYMNGRDRAEGRHDEYNPFSWGR